MNAGYRRILCCRAHRPGEVRYAGPACGPGEVSRLPSSGVRDPVDPAGTGMRRHRPLQRLRVGDASPDPPVAVMPLQRIGGRLPAASRLPDLRISACAPRSIPVPPTLDGLLGVLQDVPGTV